MEDKPTPALGVEPGYHISPMDTTADVAGDPGRQWSPMNFTGDAGFDSDSLGADDLPVADLTMPAEPTQQSWDNNTGRDYGRASYDTPVIGDAEHHFQDNDENIHSTPSKMPSPSRDRTASSVRSSRLAEHAPPSRTYPTPTPTSSLEEENQTTDSTGEHQMADPHLRGGEAEDEDPTDDHEEFDSIMESEGFTMISLDTLPSAKQHGLGSSARTATDNPSKILRDRENGRIGEQLKRKLPGTISDLRNDNQSSIRSSPAGEGYSPAPNTLARRQSPPAVVSYPDLPTTFSLVKPVSPPKRKPLTSLSKLVRVGMALQGPFRPPENEWAGDSNINRKERLDDIFGTFSPDTRRELRAAMALGQELATRQTRAEEEAETEAVAAENQEASPEDYGDDDQVEEDEVDVVVQSPHSQKQISPQKDPSSASRTTREEEWQMEREIVSRNAEDPTNSQRVVYIASDEASQRDSVDREDHRDDSSLSVESVREDVSVGEEFLDEEPVDNHFNDAELAGETIEEEPIEEEPFEEVFIEEEPVEEELLEEEPEELPSTRNQDLVEEEPWEYGSQHTSGPLPIAAQDMEMEPQIVDDDMSDIWQESRYAESVAKSEPSPLPTASHTIDMEPEVLNDEEDGVDIWQEEARDHSFLSDRSNEDEHVSAPEPASPWRRTVEVSSARDYLSSSPAYVSLDQNDTLHLDQNHIRQLRNKEIDLSAILAEEDTPNRARYYNDTSTPRSILRNRAQPSSISGSAVKSNSPKKRVRLQTISQSPDRELEPGYEDHVATHQDRQDPGPLQQQKIERDGSVSEASIHETESIHEDLTATPEAPRPADNDAPASTWFQRVDSLTPRWLKAPTKTADDSSSVASEDEPEDDDQSEPERLATTETAKEINEDLEVRSASNRSSESPWRHVDEPEFAPQVGDADHVSPAEEDIEESIERNDPGDQVDGVADLIDADHEQPTGPRPLATFGYFSDAHYKALRRVYRMAKRRPERFPYYDAPARSAIIGDWIWTSNGRHGVPITEAQFAIIDRFVHDLSRADAAFGGSGQVEWTDADLHRRLVSVIIGEQIREERQAKATRGTSVEPWR